MKSLLFWLSVAVLFPQALYVRRTAPRFAPASGPTAGVVGTGETVRLFAIGDSIIAGVGALSLDKALVGQTAASLASALKKTVSWEALGVSGYDAVRIREYLVPRMPVSTFDYIIVSVGVNDITGLTRLANWTRNLGMLLDKLRAHSPDARIAITGPPPLELFPLLPEPLRTVFGMRARMFDHAARGVVGRYLETVYLPIEFEPDPKKFSADGYHPSEAGYTVFGQRMADALLKESGTGIA